MSYTSLHNHSAYSNLRLLDSINKIPQMVDKCVALGLKGCALTDHESLSGHIEFMQYIREGKKNGKIPEDFKCILGDEIYLIDSLEEVRNNYKKGITKYFHFILLAKDKEGHQQLRKISTQAWRNRFIQSGMERVPITKAQIEEIIGQDRGHLIFSTACSGGELAHAILTNDYSRALGFIEWCLAIAGWKDFVLEMQPNDSVDQIKINRAIKSISEKMDIPYIITTDSHYLSKDLAPIHEAYLQSRGNEDREVDEFYRSCYFMSAEEIHEWMDEQIGFDAVEQGLNNTNMIADMVEEYDLYHSQVVPKVGIPTFEFNHVFKDWYDKYEYLQKFARSSDNHDRYFLHLVGDGWLKKEHPETLPDDVKEQMVSRINDELEAIWESSEQIGDKISNYYITYRAIKDLVWDDSEDGGNSLVGDGRGSVAAFYTCYLMGVQDVNSFKFDIPYWRHLHKDRPEMPDIDFDSETRQRGRILQAVKNRFGENKVLNICTFKTEGPKSAMLTVCRGLGIDNDEASYLANMIPVKRGNTTSLKVMVYGDDEEGIRPDKQFIDECNKHDHLLDYALQIEGLISGRSIHASGVIIFEDDYTTLNCMMTAPNGQAVTQWNMNDSTYTGGLKFDFLTVTNLDVMHICLDFLCEYGYIQWQGNLRKTFEKYFSPDVINYDDPEMWRKAWYGEIMNLFQFDTAVGGQVIKKTKPRNLLELGVANSLERLMAQDGDTEQPVDRYIRYKDDEDKWYQLMRKQYRLTDDEIKVIEKYLLKVHGMATMQEEVMMLVMDESISGFSMKEANKLRKSIAKKKKKLQEEAQNLFYSKGEERGTRKNLLDYVWQECIRPQLGYSFSLPHVLSYSIIAVQEMNMAHFYPIIYWQCANLIVNSGSDEENADETTAYGKVGVAITNIREQGVNVLEPDVNESEFGFKPLEERSAILYGLKAINGVGTSSCNAIIANRPYTCANDFYDRMIDGGIIKTAEMVALIKAGVFNEFGTRVDLMAWFIRRNLYNPVEKLTLAQMGRIMSNNLIPEDDEHYIQCRMINFRKYVLSDKFFYKNIVLDKKIPKSGYHDRWFQLDDNAQQFFKQWFGEDSIEGCNGTHYLISEKKFSKEVDKNYIEPLIVHLNEPKFIERYNASMFDELWDKYAHGPVAHWAFEALSYYPVFHELKNIDKNGFGVVNFSEQPEDPVAYDVYYRWIGKEQKAFDKFTINRVAGTVVDKDNMKYTITLLTPDGVVKVKYNKGEYLFYGRTLSSMDTKGKKKVEEKSWFTRGTLLLVSGYRDGDIWRAKTYSDSVFKHTTNRIIDYDDKGQPIVQQERIRVDEG